MIQLIKQWVEWSLAAVLVNIHFANTVCHNILKCLQNQPKNNQIIRQTDELYSTVLHDIRLNALQFDNLFHLVVGKNNSTQFHAKNFPIKLNNNHISSSFPSW